jgi:hypothetical protein
MSDTLSRSEMSAELRAAEARTETRITQLSAALEAWGMSTDHKVDRLTTKMDGLADVIGRASQESKEDNKHTRRAIWEVGVGAIIAVLALSVALWVAGLNIQSNMLSAFQAGIGIRTVGATNPPAALAPTPAQPNTPAKTSPEKSTG